MEKTTDPTVQQLLDELKERSYLVRQQQIAKALEPYNDVAIPLLIKRLKSQDDNYHIRDNALEVLALSADPQAILPILRHIEIETGWTGHIFDYLRQGLKEKDQSAQRLVNNQLLQYLDEGPKIPVPEPFDPVKSQNDFMDIVSALMEQTGVTELDKESTQLVEELKERWSQPPDLSEYEKDKIPEHQNILVEVIDTLLEFGGLQESRGEALLTKYIQEYGFDSIAAQHALTALAGTNPVLAMLHLEEWNSNSPSKPDVTIKRVVMNKSNSAAEVFDFTLCVREPTDPTWKERPYYFSFEKGLVFFRARSEASHRWFVGQAADGQSAVQTATQYLEHWIQNIDMLNGKQTQTGKYSRIYNVSRHAEFVHLIQQHIDFEKWGFKQTHISERYEYPHERPQIIYDSEWCRVKFAVRSYGEMHDQSDVLNIQYGRLHAADKEESIVWHGEPHHCWHHVSLALCFLDNLSAEEAAKVLWDYPKLPEYKILEVPQPVKEAERHAAIWERYGQRLFELFDVRHSEAWERFSLYVKQVYLAKGWKHSGHGIPREKIC